jgi:predicted PurR-regulated permease PerM
MANDVSRVTEVAIRIGSIALLVIACLRIVAPFAAPFVWGAIIAVAAVGFYTRLLAGVGGRTKTAAAIFTLIGFLVLIVPGVMLSDTLVSGAREYAGQLAEGTLKVPPPPASVADWPLIGSSLYPFWQLSSQNLEAAVVQLKPQLKALSGPLLAMAKAAGVATVEMLVSIVIAAVLLVHAEGSARFTTAFASRIAGARGPELVSLSRATIQSVAVGILGVAVIQSILAGLGFLAAGVPGAGLWALMVLIAAMIQLPVILLMLPIIVYVFTAASMPVAIAFTVWSMLVGVVDNILKPILFAKGGADVPVLVIFLGSIGGMLATGLLGLFIGPVILAVGYEVLRMWLSDDDAVVPSGKNVNT